MASRFAKTSKSFEILDETNAIEFEINNEKYKLIISNNQNKIQIILQDLSSSTEYFLESTLEDLKKINRYFSIFSDTGDLNVNLIKQVKKNNITIQKDNDFYNFQIKNPITDEDFSLKLEKSQSITTETQSTNVTSESPEIVTKLKKKIEDLEKRMKDLESKISEGKNIGIISEEIDDDKIFNSNIIKHKEEQVIKTWFNTKILSTELLFDTNVDGDSIEDFKNKCVGQFPTLILIKTDMGFLLGGYTTTAWKENASLTDYNSFVFSFNPDKKYNVTIPRYALFGCNEKENLLFQFGSVCFRIENHCTKSGNNVIRGSGYEKGLIDLIKGDHKFRVSRLEVFKLNF